MTGDCLPFVDTGPTIEQRGSVVVVTIGSGTASQSFAFTFHAARMLVETGRREMDAIDRKACDLLPMHPVPSR